MMVYTFIIVILVALLPDLYIWGSFIKGGRLLWSVLYWLPTAALILLPVVALIGKWQDELFQLLIFLTLLFVIPKLVFVLFSLVGRGLAMLVPTSASICNGIGLTVALLIMMTASYGIIKGWKHVVVKETDIVSEDVPRSFDGYTIVHLSDFHIGTYKQSPGTVREIVDKVNAICPDAIFFTGDLVTLRLKKFRCSFPYFRK